MRSRDGEPDFGPDPLVQSGLRLLSRFRYRGVIGNISNIAHCAICNIEVKRMKYQTTILPLRQTLCLSNCERMVVAILQHYQKFATACDCQVFIDLKVPCRDAD